MKNKFLQISIGVSMMLLSAGFLVHSIGSANAALPTPEKFIDQGAAHAGRYMMDYGITQAHGQTDPFYETLIWDTQTGKSAMYIFANGVWTLEKYQLPAQPLH